MTFKHHIVLIGCAKTKQKSLFDATGAVRPGVRVTPGMLYGGQLFDKRVKYATERSLPWYVLSAKYGVWAQTTLLKPYDYIFAQMEKAERIAWHSSVCNRLVEELWEPFNTGDFPGPIDPSELCIEIHAGADYAHPLAELLQALGIHVELPVSGLGIGEQLAWYSNAGALAA